MSVVISAVGACTPVGLHADATCAALRAGVANIVELATYMVTGEVVDREPMAGGRVPTEWLTGEPEEEAWPGHERFGLTPPPPLTSLVEPGVERVLELAAIALDELHDRARIDQVPIDSYRVYVGVNETESTAEIRELLQTRLGGDAARFVVEPSGRAGGLSMLTRALADIRAKRCTAALVGGVDSLIRAPMAAKLDAVRRLKSDTEPQGLIPGEGAAFVFIEDAGAASARELTPLATLVSAAIGDEPSAGTEDPNQGVGLTHAIRDAREASDMPLMPLVVCDLNGERPRALEWTLAGTRALGDLEGDLVVWHPADCTGDPGAAVGILNVLWAATALHRGYAPNTQALIWGASDGALRGACVLDKIAPSETS